MKKVLSVILSLLLILGPAAMLQVMAEPAEEPPASERHDGPLTAEVSPNPFALMFVALNLIELNEDGTSKIDEEGNAVYYNLFRNEWDEGASAWKIGQDALLPDGVAYDFETNTVTFTDFNGSDCMLYANMMGDGLTLRVNGACSLGRIIIWGDGWGGGLKITGAGSLTVNGKNLFDYAIEFHPEGADITFRLDKNTTLKLYAQTDAVGILGTTQTESIFDLPDGVEAEPKKETYVAKQNKILNGYTIDADYCSTSTYTLGVCRDDPDGIYTVQEVTYYPSGVDQPGIPRVEVTHYFYTEKYDFYLEDRNFGPEPGKFERVFDDLEAAKAAGFEQAKDEHGDKVYIEMRTPYGSSRSSVVIGPDGNEYAAAFTKKSDGDYDDVLADIEPLPGVEDTYLFVVRKDLMDVDTHELKNVTVDVVYEGVYSWTIPGKTFVYEGAGAGLTGDVDGNGEITPGDARLALRISLGLMKDGSVDMTDDMVARADADGKDGVQPADARLILRKSLGITDPEWKD